MSSNIFADYAHKIHGQGWSIIPVNGKAPFFPEWNQYKERPPTEEEMDSWVEKYPTCNIGFPLGQANGLVALDIDFGDLFEFKENHALIKEWADKILSLLPNTPLVRLGMKPYAALFRFSNQLNGPFEVNGISIGELISAGQIVVPPSVHPDTGEEYSWMTMGLAGMSQDEMLELVPEFTEQDFAKLKAEMEVFIDPALVVRWPDNADGTPGEPGSVKHGRNNRLKGMGLAILGKGKTHEEAVEELIKEDKRLHAVPLFTDKTDTYKNCRTPREAAQRLVTNLQKYVDKVQRQRGELLALAPAHSELLGVEGDEPLRIAFRLGKKGNVLCSLENVMKCLEYAKWRSGREIWFDSFYQRIFLKQSDGTVREWRDVDDINLTLALQRTTELANISEKTVSRAVISYAYENTRNEPQDWLNSLEWDKIDRISDLLWKAFGTLPSDYANKAGANFMISMVARILEPGCKVDNMLVLEGSQGKGKSSALSVIGQPWFMESVETIGTIDFLQALQGKMLVEIAELDSFNKADSRTIKKTVTCRVDRYRASYGRHSKDYPRQCVFVGTTNDDEYLEDPTGGRRFWPIKTGNISLEWLAENREQLFAEAVYRYKAKESWWEMPEQAGIEQAERRRKDAWEDKVGHWLAKNKETELALYEVAEQALEIKPADFGKSEQMRLASVLKVLGCSKDHTQTGNRWSLVTSVSEHLRSAVEFPKSRPQPKTQSDGETWNKVVSLRRGEMNTSGVQDE